MTRSRSLATAAVVAFYFSSGSIPIISLFSAQDGHQKDTDDETNRHGYRTFIDTKNTKKSNGMLSKVMGVHAFSPSANTFSNVRQAHPSQTMTKRRRSMHILSYRPDQASQTDQAGPMLWQYIFFANWDETYVRVLKSPQESTYVSPNGWTPLHLLMTSSGFPPPLKVVKAVYAAFPQALRMPTNDYGRTPLDLAKRTDQPKEIIDFLENPPKLEGDDDDYYVQPRAVMANDLDDGVCIDIDEDGACIVVEDDDDNDDYTNGNIGVNNQAQDAADQSYAYEESSPQPQSSQAQTQASPTRPSPPKKVSVDSTINQQVEEQKRYQEQLRRKLEQRQLEEQMEYEQYQDRYYSQQTMMMEEERRRQQLMMEQQQEEAMERQRRQYIEQQKQQQQGFAPRQPFHSATAASTANGSSSNVAEGVNGRRQGAAPAGMSNAGVAAQQQANQVAIQQMMAPLQDRIKELTTRYDALIRTKGQDAAKIESLEKELQNQRDMERQMRSAHYAEISEAQEAAEERLVEYKEEIERLKEQLEGTREEMTNGSEKKKNIDEQNIDKGDDEVKAKLKVRESKSSNGATDTGVDEIEDLRKEIKLLTNELKEKNA